MAHDLSATSDAAARGAIRSGAPFRLREAGVLLVAAIAILPIAAIAVLAAAGGTGEFAHIAGTVLRGRCNAPC